MIKLFYDTTFASNKKLLINSLCFVVFIAFVFVNDRVKQLSKNLLIIDQVVYEFLSVKLGKDK